MLFLGLLLRLFALGFQGFANALLKLHVGGFHFVVEFALLATEFDLLLTGIGQFLVLLLDLFFEFSLLFVAFGKLFVELLLGLFGRLAFDGDSLLLDLLGHLLNQQFFLLSQRSAIPLHLFPFIGRREQDQGRKSSIAAPEAARRTASLSRSTFQRPLHPTHRSRGTSRSIRRRWIGDRRFGSPPLG